MATSIDEHQCHISYIWQCSVFAKKERKEGRWEKNNRYATAYFEASVHMAVALNGGVNLACLKTRIMMINVTAWKLITIVSLRFPIMPQTLLWKLIWIFYKSKRQSCSKAIWHVPSPVYISSGLAEELKNNHARCLLTSRKRASPVAILFLFFFFFPISLLSENVLRPLDMLNLMSRCCVCEFESSHVCQVLQHHQIYSLLLFVVVLVRGETRNASFVENCVKINWTEGR